MTLYGCSSKPPELQPIPPEVIEVPVYRELPAGSTDPCPRPHATADDIQSDVDLTGLLAQWITTAICDEGKLKAIGALK